MKPLSPRMAAALGALELDWLCWPWDLPDIYIRTLEALERRGLAIWFYDLDAPQGSMHRIFWKKEKP